MAWTSNDTSDDHLMEVTWKLDNDLMHTWCEPDENLMKTYEIAMKTEWQGDEDPMTSHHNNHKEGEGG